MPHSNRSAHSRKHPPAVAPGAEHEVARALVDVALLYRAQHRRLQRSRRGHGLDRRWSRLADRARLSRSLLFALLDDLTGTRAGVPVAA